MSFQGSDEDLDLSLAVPIDPELAGKIVGKDEVILLTLTALADMWDEEAGKLEKQASRSGLFGPKMMIMSAEGSVLMGCSRQLREAIKVARGR